MPYIEPLRRHAMFHGEAPTNAGELNFVITVTLLINHPRITTLVLDSNSFAGIDEEIFGICRRYIEQDGVRYQKINDAIGACVCAGMEFARRTRACGFEIRLLAEVARQLYVEIAAPYEDKKIAENGDISYDHPSP